MSGSRQDLYDSNMMRAAAIRSYSLFGESGELPDVLHCETIATRSSLHGWELEPHRHARLHQLLLLRQGGGSAWLESGRTPLRPRTLVNVPCGDVHAFSFTPGTQGWVVTLPDELVADLLTRAGESRAVLDGAGTASADAALVRVMAEIARESAGASAARALVLRGLAAAALGLASRALSLQAPATPDLAASNLLRRFEALLEAHVIEHWPVARYAQALSITPTHLSRLTRAATGQGASVLIEERLMREARRQLAFSSLPVKSVAYALGFADPAHFSRAFARAAGRSPRQFREALSDRR
jgi:AraC family transcriptional activator of pobA